MGNKEIEIQLKMSLLSKVHPISEMPQDIQDRYFIGLGAVLSKVSVNNLRLKAMYDQWCLSICGHTYDAFYPHRQRAKDALALNRIGVRMFRMSYEFFFDCFYLIELFNPDMIGNVYYYLHDQICGFSTRDALQNIRLLFWKEIRNEHIPKELITLREANKKFLLSPAKRVLVVANMSAGKSTLVNAIVGRQINEVANTACTNRLRTIYNKADDCFFSFWDIIGKKVVRVTTEAELKQHNPEQVACSFLSLLKNENICFIDTPGVNNSKDTTHEEITYEAIKRNDYDLLLFVADGRYPGTTDEKTLLEYIANKTSVPIVVAVNQLDTYRPDQDSIEKVLKDYAKTFGNIGLKNVTVLPTSGWLSLLDKLPDETQDMLEVGMEKMYKERFYNDFYDLQYYVTHEHSSLMLERTGLVLLEQTIAMKLRGE